MVTGSLILTTIAESGEPARISHAHWLAAVLKKEPKGLGLIQ